MSPKSTLPEIQHFLPCDPDCRKQKFCKKIWEKVPPKIRSFFYISPVELPLLFILSFCLLFTNHPIEKIGITLSSLIQFILEALYIHFFFRTISTKPKYISNSYTDFNHNNSIEQYLKIKFTDFKTWLQEYPTSNNSPLDYSAHIKKNPIEILISIFKPQKKDFKFIWAILTILTIHLSLYYFNLIYFVDVLRIILTAIVVVYVTKNIYSAYINSSLIVDSFKSHPLQFFTSIIALGGLSALTIPATMNIFKLIGDSTALTTAMLGITGGIIAVFGLIKSHQKSELEREQLEVQKQKDSRDYIRQLYSTYGDRFDKAVTELNNNDRDANIAFAAVYKLSHLADDWLEFKNLATSEKDLSKFEDKANAEVQTIINVFCKYIRSMPYGYTDKMLESGDIPKEDAEIRRLIFSEISDHLGKILKHSNNIEIIPGPWSHFNFDFNNARIFYPLNNLIIKNSNFSDVVFHGEAKCNQTVFIDELNFSTTPFNSTADFSGATFMKKVIFEGPYTMDIFKKSAYFENAIFAGAAHFSHMKFSDNAYFKNANFKQEAKFEFAVFKNSSYFTSATFEGNADFTSATFENTTTFNHATFIGDSIFSFATFFKDSTFVGVSFRKKVRFDASFKQFSPAFKMILMGQPEMPNMRARFSLHSAQKDYNFSTYNGQTIPRGEAELDGVERTIPIGTVLFNPDIKDKNTGEYTHVSEPAK